MSEQLKPTSCENCPIVEKAAWALALHNYKARDAEGNIELRQVRTEKEWKEWLLRSLDCEHPEIFNSRIVKKDDKVEIVRCKDCISYNALDRYCEAHSKSSYDYSYYAGNDFCFYVDDDDYCSFAKRKDEEE